MGWGMDTGELSFVKYLYEQEEECKQLILESDVVIFGWTGREELIVPRLQAGKLTFRNSERIYKTGQWKAVSPRGLADKYKTYTRYRKSPYYLLCAGGYVASDFQLIRSFPDKKLVWGYFPEAKQYEIEQLMERQRRTGEDIVELLWAGRFISWKHPEYAIRLARDLKQKGYRFKLTMAGGGDMDGELRNLARQSDVLDVVQFTGFLKPEQIRQLMESTNVYLFTSDYEEGWGAVLNEAMNSGCGVVVNHALGAAPTLIQHEKNGLLYENGNYEQFVEQVERLIKSPKLCEELGRAAYDAIVHIWNADNAAERLLLVCEGLLDGRAECFLQDEGPCSQAAVVSPGRMYRYLTNGEG